MKINSTWIHTNIGPDFELKMYIPENSVDCRRLNMEGKCKDCVQFHSKDSNCSFWQDVEIEGYANALIMLESRIDHINSTDAEDRMIEAQERGMV